MKGAELVADEWMSNIIGVSAYVLKIKRGRGVEFQRPAHNAFISTKISTESREALWQLQDSGFRLIGVEIDLERSGGAVDVSESRARFSRRDDEGVVRELARDGFAFDRFHRDPTISAAVADRIKEEWAGNYFTGKRGQWMVVAEQAGAVCGFLQLLDAGGGRIRIDLIGVGRNHRGQGLAKSMIAFAAVNAGDGSGRMTVGTQLQNTSSLALYTDLGFRIKSSLYVLHYHG